MKTCVKCKTEKDEKYFSPSKSKRGGLYSRCKACRRGDAKARREKKREYDARHYAEDPERTRKNRERYYAENKERLKIKSDQWAAAHPKRITEFSRRANAKLYGTAKGKINNAMANRMRHSLHGTKAGRSWESLVGYSVSDLLKHLEKQFTPEMTWENHGSYWSIDHITPIAAFNFGRTEDIDFKKCWSLKNLRPLEAKANKRKGARMNKPFQPALTI